MTYPKPAFQEKDQGRIMALIRNYPFAHLFSTDPSDPRVTRIPVVLDEKDGQPWRLRGHVAATNPQAAHLDGRVMIAAFSGPHSYVSAHWRTDLSRASTWDYQAVHIWGRARMQRSRAFFAQLISDLATSAEQAYKIGPTDPEWTFADAPLDYVDAMVPHLVCFELIIERIEAISKLHQTFGKADRISVSDKMHQSTKPDTQTVASAIQECLETTAN